VRLCLHPLLRPPPPFRLLRARPQPVQRRPAVVVAVAAVAPPAPPAAVNAAISR
jgi:hypothetical protein